MQRRSSARAPRKKYTVDAFDAVPELRDISRSTSPGERSDQDADADAFQAGAGDASDDEISEAEAEELSDARSADVTDDDEDVIDVETPTTTTRTRKPRSTQRKQDGQVFTNRRYHDNNFRSSSKDLRYSRFYGSGSGDAKYAVAALHRWGNLPVLPSKTSSILGRGGFRYAQADSAVCQQLYKIDWLWYVELGGKQIFQDKQRCTFIDRSISAVTDFLPPAREPLDFLTGPVDSPNHNVLRSLEAISLADAWRGKDGASDRTGFILNAGARVRALQWLPSCGGSMQYVAVSVLPDRPSDHEPFQALVAPAVAATPRYKTAMQIWQVDTNSQAQSVCLKAVLLASWGDNKCFEFCQIPCQLNEESPLILAGIWSDGKLRVVLLPHEVLLGDEPRLLHFDDALIELTPPDTVFTCLTWVSPRILAAGTASGCVAMIDIDECLRTGLNRPYKYSSISDTYIHAIASCQPSFPHLICTLSMDGHLRLTDSSQANMSSPENNAQGLRVRALLPSLAWSDIAQCALVTDDNFNLRAYPLRRMYSHFSVARYKSTAVTIASSPCHPCVLAGTAGGDVVATNPTVKLQDPKKPTHAQTWFSHEWRHPVADDDARPDSARMAKNGISRFVDGFKAESVKFSDGDGSQRSYVPQTVYEKETAVTAIAWNPNIVAAGWAAAGLADGLIRIEDIALPE